MIRRLVLLLAAAILGATTASCAAVSVDSIPMPHDNYSDGYDLTLQFASALNLPHGAKVVMDGTKIGTVARVDLAPDHVDVDARINAGAEIPANIRASLQQDTVLGDIYIAFIRDPGRSSSAAVIPHDGVLPLQQTTSPPPLEDTIAVLANFVTSGTIQRVQKSIVGLNRATPADRDDVVQLADQVAHDLNELSTNLDDVDRLLNGVTATTRVLGSNAAVLGHYLSPAGMVGWDRATFSSSYISTLLPSVGSIYEGGFWLVPMLNTLVDATGSARNVGIDVLHDGPAWQRLFVHYFLPFAMSPSVNITSITGPDGRELVGDVTTVLRMLGAVR